MDVDMTGGLLGVEPEGRPPDLDIRQYPGLNIRNKLSAVKDAVLASVANNIRSEFDQIPHESAGPSTTNRNQYNKYYDGGSSSSNAVGESGPSTVSKPMQLLQDVEGLLQDAVNAVPYVPEDEREQYMVNSLEDSNDQVVVLQNQIALLKHTNLDARKRLDDQQMLHMQLQGKLQRRDRVLTYVKGSLYMQVCKMRSEVMQSKRKAEGDKVVNKYMMDVFKNLEALQDKLDDPMDELLELSAQEDLKMNQMARGAITQLSILKDSFPGDTSRILKIMEETQVLSEDMAARLREVEEKLKQAASEDKEALVQLYEREKEHLHSQVAELTAEYERKMLAAKSNLKNQIEKEVTIMKSNIQDLRLEIEESEQTLQTKPEEIKKEAKFKQKVAVTKYQQEMKAIKDNFNVEHLEGVERLQEEVDLHDSRLQKAIAQAKAMQAQFDENVARTLTLEDERQNLQLQLDKWVNYKVGIAEDLKTAATELSEEEEANRLAISGIRECYRKLEELNVQLPNIEEIDKVESIVGFGKDLAQERKRVLQEQQNKAGRELKDLLHKHNSKDKFISRLEGQIQQLEQQQQGFAILQDSYSHQIKDAYDLLKSLAIMGLKDDMTDGVKNALEEFSAETNHRLEVAASTQQRREQKDRERDAQRKRELEDPSAPAAMNSAGGSGGSLDAMDSPSGPRVVQDFHLVLDNDLAVFLNTLLDDSKTPQERVMGLWKQLEAKTEDKYLSAQDLPARPALLDDSPVTDETFKDPGPEPQPDSPQIPSALDPENPGSNALEPSSPASPLSPMSGASAGTFATTASDSTSSPLHASERTVSSPDVKIPTAGADSELSASSDASSVAPPSLSSLPSTRSSGTEGSSSSFTDSSDPSKMATRQSDMSQISGFTKEEQEMRQEQAKEQAQEQARQAEAHQQQAAQETYGWNPEVGYGPAGPMGYMGPEAAFGGHPFGPFGVPEAGGMFPPGAYGAYGQQYPYQDWAQYGYMGQYPGAEGWQGQYPGAEGWQGQYPGAEGWQGQYPGAEGWQGQYPGAAGWQGQYPGAEGWHGQYPGAEYWQGWQGQYPGVGGLQGEAGPHEGYSFPFGDQAAQPQIGVEGVEGEEPKDREPGTQPFQGGSMDPSQMGSMLSLHPSQTGSMDPSQRGTSPFLGVAQSQSNFFGSNPLDNTSFNNNSFNNNSFNSQAMVHPGTFEGNGPQDKARTPSPDATGAGPASPMTTGVMGMGPGGPMGIGPGSPMAMGPGSPMGMGPVSAGMMTNRSGVMAPGMQGMMTNRSGVPGPGMPGMMTNRSGAWGSMGMMKPGSTASMAPGMSARYPPSMGGAPGMSARWHPGMGPPGMAPPGMSARYPPSMGGAPGMSARWHPGMGPPGMAPPGMSARYPPSMGGAPGMSARWHPGMGPPGMAPPGMSARYPPSMGGAPGMSARWHPGMGPPGMAPPGMSARYPPSIGGAPGMSARYPPGMVPPSARFGPGMVPPSARFGPGMMPVSARFGTDPLMSSRYGPGGPGSEAAGSAPGFQAPSVQGSFIGKPEDTQVDSEAEKTTEAKAAAEDPPRPPPTPAKDLYNPSSTYKLYQPRQDDEPAEEHQPVPILSSFRPSVPFSSSRKSAARRTIDLTNATATAFYRPPKSYVDTSAPASMAGRPSTAPQRLSPSAKTGKTAKTDTTTRLRPWSPSPSPSPVPTAAPDPKPKDTKGSPSPSESGFAKAPTPLSSARPHGGLPHGPSPVASARAGPGSPKSSPKPGAASPADVASVASAKSGATPSGILANGSDGSGLGVAATAEDVDPDSWFPALSWTIEEGWATQLGLTTGAKGGGPIAMMQNELVEDLRAVCDELRALTGVRERFMNESNFKEATTVAVIMSRIERVLNQALYPNEARPVTPSKPETPPAPEADVPKEASDGETSADDKLEQAPMQQSIVPELPPEVARLLQRIRLMHHTAQSWAEAREHWAGLEKEVREMPVFERLEARTYLLVEKLSFRRELVMRQTLDSNLDFIAHVDHPKSKAILVPTAAALNDTSMSQSASQIKSDSRGASPTRLHSSSLGSSVTLFGPYDRATSTPLKRSRPARQRSPSPKGRSKLRPTSALPRLGSSLADSAQKTSDSLFVSLPRAQVTKLAGTHVLDSTALAADLLDDVEMDMLRTVNATGRAPARQQPPANPIVKALGLSTGMVPLLDTPKPSKKAVGHHRKKGVRATDAVAAARSSAAPYTPSKVLSSGSLVKRPVSAPRFTASPKI